jgi:uncharacterized membrane protein/glutaredoxin
MSRIHKTLLVSLLAISLLSPSQTARSQGAVVHAVLFYSPFCEHCNYVNREFLPLIKSQYGDQLQILSVDTTQESGHNLFVSALQKFNLESGGVPFLVIGDQYLVGSKDIPEQFPALIEQYLALGGVGWPAIPRLEETLGGMNSAPEPTLTPTHMPGMHAVLFTRGTCSHCQQIVEEVISPLIESYGNQLQILSVDVSLPDGDALYDAAIQQYHIEDIGVPTLVVGDHVMVGSVEIQQEFFAIIEGGLAKGGTDWPDLPGLQEMLASSLSTSTPPSYITPTVNMTGTADSPPVIGLTPTPGLLLSGEHSNLPLTSFALDPLGNSLAVFILLGMVASVIWSIAYLRAPDRATKPGLGMAVPVLCIVGLGVAAYLAYVEVTQATAVCGPVGDCNSVQQSEYARLFGILPIGILGMAGYAMIFVAWLVMQSSKRMARNVSMVLLALTFFGTFFSIYLTILELFVIRAVCAWCLSSAVIMTLLMLVSLRPARSTIGEWKRKRDRRFR